MALEGHGRHIQRSVNVSKNDVPRLTRLWTALPVILALLQLRRCLRKLEKMPRATGQGGGIAGGPLSRVKAFALFRPMRVFLPRHKGTRTWSDLLSATVTATKIHRSRDIGLGRRHLPGPETLCHVSVKTFGAGASPATINELWDDSGVVGGGGLSSQVREGPGIVQRKARSCP